MDNDNDPTLVRRCLAGEQAAFEKLLERYEKPIFNTALRLLNDRDDARDVTQTVFLKAYQNLNRYDPAHKFFSWIYRISVNESIDLMNQRSRQGTLDERQLVDNANPESHAGSDEICDSVQQALTRVTPDYRTVIVLKHFLGMSYRDIGETLGIPEKTVKSRLFSGRQQLRDVLKNCGLM